MPAGVGYPPGQRPVGRPQIPEADFPANAPRGLGQPQGRPATGQADPAQAGVEQASPEEQKIYNTFVALFMKALYDEKLLPQTVAFLRDASDPVDAVAEVASLIAMRVFTFAKEKGTEIPGDVLLHAGKDEIIPLTVELAEEAGAAEFTPEMIERAFYAAADRFAKGAREMGVYGEDVMAADMQALDQMADSGELDYLLQGIDAAQQQPAEPAPHPPGGRTA